MDTNELVNADRGYASRKFWFAIGSVAAIVVEACLCGLWPALIPLYGDMVGGTMAALALYVTGNVSSKYVIGKTNPAVTFAGEQWHERVAEKVATKVTEKLQPKPPAAPGGDHVDPKDQESGS